jgi:hypothetical protein
VAAEDVAADQSGARRRIADTVFDSFALQLDLSFTAPVYGLAGLFLGSLIGELLTAAVLPRHPTSLRIRGRTYCPGCRYQGKHLGNSN